MPGVQQDAVASFSVVVLSIGILISAALYHVHRGIWCALLSGQGLRLRHWRKILVARALGCIPAACDAILTLSWRRPNLAKLTSTEGACRERQILCMGRGAGSACGF